MDIKTMTGIGAIVAALTPFVMQGVKKFFPTWNKKAWFPLVFGSIASVGTAMAAGQLLDWQSAVIAFLVGLGAGGTASSVRDVVVGK